MRVTSKQISKAIEEKTGHVGVNVWIDRKNLIAQFYVDDKDLPEGETLAPIDHASSSTLYCVYKLSQLSVDEWVSAYMDCIEEDD